MKTVLGGTGSVEVGEKEGLWLGGGGIFWHRGPGS